MSECGCAHYKARGSRGSTTFLPTLNVGQMVGLAHFYEGERTLTIARYSLLYVVL